jgi:hypothetical protein
MKIAKVSCWGKQNQPIPSMRSPASSVPDVHSEIHCLLQVKLELPHFELVGWGRSAETERMNGLNMNVASHKQPL